MTMNPIRVAVVAGVVAALSAASVAIAVPTTITPGTLSVCTYPRFAPFTSFGASGEWQGWDAAFLTDFASEQGLAVATESVTPFKGIWTRPGKDECDIAAAGITNLAERRAESPGTTWSSTYYVGVRAFAVRAGTRLRSVEDMAGKTVVVTKGSTSHKDITQQITQYRVMGVTVKYTNDVTAAVDLVSKGKVFAYGGCLGCIQYQAGLVKNIRVAWPHRILLASGARGSEPFAYPVRAADAGLVEALNIFIAENRAKYGK